jgi:hypothetical protein
MVLEENVRLAFQFGVSTVRELQTALRFGLGSERGAAW